MTPAREAVRSEELVSAGARVRWALWCGLVAGPLFTIGYLVLGAVRGGGYDPLRHPVSSLAIGPDGWQQAVNFAVLAVLLGILGWAFWVVLPPAGGPRSAAILTWLIATGFAGAAAFVTDPIGGYPPGTPAVATSNSLSGQLHDMFSALFFLGFPALALVVARFFARLGRRGWARYSMASAVAMLAFFIAAAVGFLQLAGLGGLAGVLQRASITVALAWFSAVSWFFLSLSGGRARVGPGAQ